MDERSGYLMSGSEQRIFLAVAGGLTDLDIIAGHRPFVASHRPTPERHKGLANLRVRTTSIGVSDTLQPDA
jgi:hypothetical protein